MGKFRFRGRRRRNRIDGKRSERIPLKAIVPNLVTSLAACAGMTSIVLSSTGEFSRALLALVVACICDGLDGRIARLLKASSKLGAELDSLADFVNFGVAPAMFMFFWLTGKYFGGEALITDDRLVRLILGASLFYAMCDCFRLARFNTMLEQETAPYWKHFFTGVPAPGGCWMVLSPSILAIALDAKGSCHALQCVFQSPAFGIFMLVFVGALMASRLPTISLKKAHISKKWMLPVMAALLMLVAFLVSNFWLTVGVVGVIYFFTIPISAVAFVKARTKFNEDSSLTSMANKE